MPKQANFTPDEFERYVDELVDLWATNKVVYFAQRVIDLRYDYRKGAVTELLTEVTNRLPDTPERKHTAFKLFETGDRVAATEDLFSGGTANRVIARANEYATVIDNNRNESERYITVQFDGKSHKVVANASLFRDVDVDESRRDAKD